MLGVVSDYGLIRSTSGRTPTINRYQQLPNFFRKSDSSFPSNITINIIYLLTHGRFVSLWVTNVTNAFLL